MKIIKILPCLLLLVFLASCAAPESSSRISQDNIPPFGTSEDIAYAELIWSNMETERLVGKNEVRLEPFFGGAKPHGMVLELVYRDLQVNNHIGFIVVKKNYDGEDVSVEAVKKDRSKYLSSITLMYQRGSGYDNDNKNWFWAKYNPDGSIFEKKVNSRTMQLAGRISKGETLEQNRGCLYCHRSAGGGDYIFYPEIKIPGE